jgi:predicted  nucleic acid-binding Zn-ribbon protein
MGDGQIAALQQMIAEINVQIARLEQAHGQSVDQSERARLDAEIASRQETRQALEDALGNLELPPEGVSSIL